MKTKSFIFTFPHSCEKMDDEINDFLEDYGIGWEDSNINYDFQESYVFVNLCWENKKKKKLKYNR